MRKPAGFSTFFCLVFCLLFTASCKEAEKKVAEPDRISVQQILIAFSGTIDKPEIKRSREEAAALVEKIQAEIQQGADFDSLVRRYTDDQYPGIYKMSNFNVEPDADEYPRSKMVKGFGDTAFKLAPDETAVCEYEPTLRYSPYGWHIIKRLQ